MLLLLLLSMGWAFDGSNADGEEGRKGFGDVPSKLVIFLIGACCALAQCALYAWKEVRKHCSIRICKQIQDDYLLLSPPDRDRPRRRERRVRHSAGQACPRPPPGRHRRLRPLPEGHGREGDLPGEGTEPDALRGGVAGEKTKEVGRGNLQQMCKIAKPSICRHTLAALATIL